MSNPKGQSIDYHNMSDKQLIAFCRKRINNWKEIPKERVNDAIISAVIDAHPKGIEIIYSIRSQRRPLHVEEALFKWKSKALKCLRGNDLPRHEGFICALIAEDPDCFKCLPRDLKSQATVDAAILADSHNLFEAPRELVHERHILIALERDPTLLQKTFNIFDCPLSSETIDALIEKSPAFLLNSNLYFQLNFEQHCLLSDKESSYWNYRRLPSKQTIQIIQHALKNPMPGPGTLFITRRVEYIKEKSLAEIAQMLMGTTELQADICLVALDVNDPHIFGRHVKNENKLMPYYQQIYGAESAMQLSNSPKVRREILDRDMGY